MGMITIKEASKIVDKVPLTVRRAIYKAPKELKSTNDKGHLLIDEEYITSAFAVNSNELEQSIPISDKSIDTLRNELNNKQKTIDSLNERLKEFNLIIGSQQQQLLGLSKSLSENNQKLLEAKEPNDDHDKVVILEERIRQLEKKSFPLLEVIMIGVCIVFAGAILFYVLSL